MNSPLPNAYWVIAGRLLAGEHPYGMDEADARVRLRRLRDAGINYFIDLTPGDEMPEYRRLLPAAPSICEARSRIPTSHTMWRRCRRFRHGFVRH